MADYGVTDIGFKLKPKSVIIENLGILMKSKFGQDLDTSAESPEGQMISVISDVASPLWELAEHCYNAFNPNAATGATLENVSQINNIKKLDATATTVPVTFTGTNGILVPADKVVSSNIALTNGIKYSFKTTEAGYITDGEYTVLAVAEVLGASQIPLNSITVIDTPIIGVTSVTNNTPGSTGRNAETDPELRVRRALSVSLPSVATVEAIRSGILSIPTVISTTIYENDSNIEKSIEGILVPPHCLRIVVQGSNTDEEKDAIAKSIFDRKDPGVNTDGAIEVSVIDSQGFDKTFRWDTPILKPVYIIVNTKSVGTGLAEDGQEIKDAIVSYANDLITGYKVGDEVSYGRLFIPINSVPNHYVQSLYIGFSPNPTQSLDLDVTGLSLATVSASNIVINVTY